jgi:hypothetical protein
MDELKPVGTSQENLHVLKIKTSQNNSAQHERENGSEGGDEIVEVPGKGEKEEIQRPNEIEDPSLVDWDGPNDPAKPINWSLKLKWTNCVIISIYTFITQVTPTFCRGSS